MTKLPAEDYVAFDIDGFWWLPGQEHRCPGHLRFDPITGTTVKLLGTLSPLQGTISIGGQPVYHQDVFGQLANGNHAVLRMVHDEVLGNMTFSASPFFSPTLHSGSYIELFENSQPYSGMVWDTAAIEFSGLEEWRAQSPYSIVHRVLDPLTMKLRTDHSITGESLSSPIGIVDCDEYTITWKQDLRGPISSSHSASYSHLDYFKVTFRRSVDSLTVLRIAYQLNAWLSILSGTPHLVRRVRTRLRAPDQSGRLGYINGRIVSTGQDAERERSRSSHFFNAQTAGPSLKYSLRAFLSFYKYLQPSIDLFMSIERNRHLYSEVAFASYVQVLEGAHQSLYGKSLYTTETKYRLLRRKMIESIRDEASKELRQSITEALALGNRYTLMQRLRDLIELVGEDLVSTICVWNDEFIKRVRDNRNLIAHGSYAYESEAAKSITDDYFRLGIIIRLLFLRLMGFDKAQLMEPLMEYHGYLLMQLNNNQLPKVTTPSYSPAHPGG